MPISAFGDGLYVQCDKCGTKSVLNYKKGKSNAEVLIESDWGHSISFQDLYIEIYCPQCKRKELNLWT